MTEANHNFDADDFMGSEAEVRVEAYGLAGVAHIKRIGREALKWQITILAENGRPICETEGTKVLGEGHVVPSAADVESVQNEMNVMIEQFIWDPMSRA